MDEGGHEDYDRKPPFHEVRAVINRHDPEGLLEIDCPEDEYDPEVDTFARLLRAGQIITRQVVIEVWEQWFGDCNSYTRDSSPEEIDTLAAVLDALRNAALPGDA